MDWLVSIPWGISTEENFDVEHAKGVLDKVKKDLIFPLVECKSSMLPPLSNYFLLPPPMRIS